MMGKPHATDDAFRLTTLPGNAGALLAARDLPPAREQWFDPSAWGAAARAVAEGGRGAAWFVDAPFGRAVLRHYRRGGLAAHISRDRYWFGEADATRGFLELRLTSTLLAAGLPVARPLAAAYWRDGPTYRAALLLERLEDVRSLASLARDTDAPLAHAGELVAHFHRAGLDHADLNAHNILFDHSGNGWLIDFDRGRLRTPSRSWREANLARLLRSLHKHRGERSRAAVDADFGCLRAAYDAAIEQAA